MGSFTPLVFGINGGMGNECQRFLKHLADKIAQKDTEPYNTVIAMLRTQISFELLRSVRACVRGSRTPFHSEIEYSLDYKINVVKFFFYFFLILFFRTIFKLNAFVLYMILNFYEISYIHFIDCIS